MGSAVRRWMSAFSCEGVAEASEATDMLRIEESEIELAPVCGRPPEPAALSDVFCITADDNKTSRGKTKSYGVG